jgi:hypothetical protein
MSLRFCERLEHSGRVIPPGETCLDCQEEEQDRQERAEAGQLECQHRSIVYTCAGCGEVVPVNGHLYPVITDQDGRILDGKHRRQADPSWFELRLEVPDDVTALAIARAANLRTPLPDDVAATIDELIKRAVQREAAGEPVTS